MANQKPGQVHVNRPLTNISIAYKQDAKEFISQKAFPVILVANQGDRYFTYERDAWFRVDAKQRGISQESAGGGFDINSDANYFAKVYAWHQDLDDQILANQDAPLRLEQDATEYVTRQLLLKQEALWKSKYFVTGLWTGSTSGGDITPSTLWDAGSSTPIKDMRAQINAMHGKTGYLPNKLILGRDVWSTLTDHATILSRTRTDARREVTTSLLADLLGLDEILIAGAVVNSAIEGAALDMGHMFEKHAMLVYSNPRPSLMTPSAGYTFAWSGFMGSGGSGIRIKRFPMDELASVRIEGEAAYDQKVVAEDLGVFFKDVIS